MTTKFFFKSFSIENFRVFNSIEFDKIRRINLISGMNGSGKSALIETIFLSLDLNNPSCLVRPFQWRGIPLGGDDLKILFPKIEEPGIIKKTTQEGHSSIEFSYGPPAKDMVLSASRIIDPNARPALSQLSAPNAVGVSIVSREGKNNGVEPNRWFMSQSGDNITATGMGIINQNKVTGVYLSQFMPMSPIETADKVSQLIKTGNKSKIVDYIRMLSPIVKDLAVFQDGAIAQTYIGNVEDKFIPLALMGGGVRALTEIVVSMMSSRNGIVFIDELDSALHFSIIPALWEVIATIAHAENVQVFAISHSRETIASAVAGVQKAGRSDDFQYVRIDDFGDSHRCVRYNIDELSNAIELHVEVR